MLSALLSAGSVHNGDAIFSNLERISEKPCHWNAAGAIAWSGGGTEGGLGASSGAE